MQNQDYLHDKQVSAPSTIGQAGARRWLYPDRRPGPRATRRKWLAAALILFYFGAPWVTFGGQPMLRLDVLNEAAYIFGLVLHLTEYNYIFFILAILGVTLFLVTTVRGRIWCGYACPQTVFVEWVIRPIEELLEGPAHRRQRADREPLNTGKIARKVVKHAAFLLVSLVVANAFLGFFIDPREILRWITSPPSLHPEAFGLVMGMTALMYFDLGWFREQFCSFLCPYARFQSALLDDRSPSVVYDTTRGEPRGKGREKGSKGDCVDCGLCVRVCPTGIDIRNGLQLECIQCERCVDACESVMTNLKRPVGLIRIDAPSAMQGRKIPFWRRARVLIYSALIVLIAVAGAAKLRARDDVTMTFVREPGSSYAPVSEQEISNVFKVRLYNNTGAPVTGDLELVEAAPGVRIICPRCAMSIDPHKEELSPFLVVFPKDMLLKETKVRARLGTRVHTLPLISPGTK